jgi:hypothetical protein
LVVQRLDFLSQLNYLILPCPWLLFSEVLLLTEVFNLSLQKLDSFLVRFQRILKRWASFLVFALHF